ncbi:TPA: LysR family transcriptional regulator [Escherichia coli]
MAKERALTLEALRVMDAIDRRGSFAAAADELGRVPSALSYTMQKLEEELDVVLFDRSGHRTKFTNVGRMLLERGRVLLEAADKLTTDAEALARGWETHLTIVTEALVPTPAFFPLIDKLAAKANTQLAIITEVLAGLGVATMPYPMVEKDIAEGRLRVVSPESTSEIDIIMAWRRDSMGEAKSWCLREIPKLFNGK